LILGIRALPATAVIKFEMPVSKIYETSQMVVTGIIEKSQLEGRLLDIKLHEVLKGEHPCERFRVQVASPPEVFTSATAGQPVVVFVGKARGGSLAVVHLADTWLLANRLPAADQPTWRVMQLHQDFKQSFPGRTAALVRILGEIKAGKSPLLDRLDQAFFTAFKKLDTLDIARPAWLLVSDLDGDHRPDLVIGTAAGPRVFMAAANSWRDATDTWLASAVGAAIAGNGYRACGDINGDGRPDLLLDDTLYLNTGQRFTALAGKFSPPSQAKPLAAALADATGDGRQEVILLANNGEMRIYERRDAAGKHELSWSAQPPRRLWAEGSPPLAAEIGPWGEAGRAKVLVVRQSGIVSYPLGPADGAPEPFDRLTGSELVRLAEGYRDGLKAARALALDVNGDGRRDMFILSEAGGLMLVNRGFGTFAADVMAGGVFTAHQGEKPRFILPPDALWAAADLTGNGREDALVLTANGELFLVASSPPRP
jgi:hypothetical protein